MHRFGRRRSSFLSKLSIFCISNTAWLFGEFMQYWVTEQRKTALTDQLRCARFASESHRNELIYIFCIYMIVLRSNWAAHCHAKGGMGVQTPEGAHRRL